MLEFNSVQELVNVANKTGKTISQIVLESQSLELERSIQDIFSEMENSLKVMEESVNRGQNSAIKSTSGLSGGDAVKFQQAINNGLTVGGNVLDKVIVKALAVAEVNACMGKIVASPTAGSCGVLPAVLLTIMDEQRIPKNKVVMGLFTAAGIGLVISKLASISGAEGGCQAEVGSASAMAAGAVVEIMGGSPVQVAHASAIALKNVLGLVCDPVAGFVEIPCIKRNTMGAANALVAANLALAGIESAIPVDEVIGAMKSVGDLMVPSLKETAEGGLAGTETGRKLAAKVLDNSHRQL